MYFKKYSGIFVLKDFQSKRNVSLSLLTNKPNNCSTKTILLWKQKQLLRENSA